MSNKIIITGGLGYIGSHIAVELKDIVDEFIIIDNLSNSDVSVIDKLKKLTKKKIIHYNKSINNENELKEIFSAHHPDSVIHLAGLKSVQEGELYPDKYFYTNVSGTVSLLNALKEYKCSNFIFSSSATVYGKPEYLPYDEEHPTVPVNNYGRTKLSAEQIIHDWSMNNNVSTVSLRYFNPVGAHESGLIGERPEGIPNNLMPYILEVISGKLKVLNIYGDDYDTKDGSGERDYIHITDLAKAHVSALVYCKKNIINDVFNIGTGESISVFDIINTFKESLNTNINYNITNRRDGDLPKYFAATSKAEKYLRWKANKSLLDMCTDSLRWQKNYNIK
jgi:UDP-glucose 4-epimerase